MSAAFTAWLTRQRLVAQLALWRYGWLPALAVGMSALGALAWLLVLGVASPALDTQRAAMDAAEARIGGQQTEAGMKGPGWSALQRALPPAEAGNKALRQVFQIAQDAGVVVAQADFKRDEDRAGSIARLQVALPLRGNYPAVEKFCFEALRQIPALSVDQVVLRRETANSDQVEGQILLSIWQKAAPAPTAGKEGS